MLVDFLVFFILKPGDPASERKRKRRSTLFPASICPGYSAQTPRQWESSAFLVFPRSQKKKHALLTAVHRTTSNGQVLLCALALNYPTIYLFPTQLQVFLNSSEGFWKGKILWRSDPLGNISSWWAALCPLNTSYHHQSLSQERTFQLPKKNDQALSWDLRIFRGLLLLIPLQKMVKNPLLQGTSASLLDRSFFSSTS